MGICGMSSKQSKVTVVNNPVPNHTIKQQSQQTTNEPQDDEQFKDFPDQVTSPQKFIGEGIKQIPSYQCSIPFDKLNELREKFWEKKFKMNRRWKAIREICESDAASAAQLLEAAGFFCEKDLRLIMEIDNPNIMYKVPNFCITDPVYERDYKSIELKEKEIQAVDISVKCFCFCTLKESSFTLSNKTTGKELKELFAKSEGLEPFDNYSIRLFYTGQEIKDEHMLCYHNIIDNGKIQINYIKKES